MHDRRTANLLGTAALAVTDLMLERVTEDTGIGASAAAALVVLAGSPGLSGTELGRRVGSSQPAAARMIDTLLRREFVERRTGRGREIAVRLTDRGRRAAADILAARSDYLTQVLAPLDTSERAILAALLDKLLTGLHSDIGNADLVCRLCDRRVCTTDAQCPVREAERAQPG
ncbi:MarR family transcriptional regulator [Nocardia jinanensis]|uniref:MarR family transcriptional regulator n=1 Tax=Nocardia jinanensis TaxID=382504 RepID=A0A917VV71_9NOCA|nr:MarR family transcriptional regulator [Nocardia jinanensis]GGL21895.1 MarR family transcriptional regulator [Nocardia jinanensis]